MTAEELFLDSPTCQSCHCALGLRDGCEWPDLSLCLCEDCAIAEIVRLRESQQIAFIQGAKWWEWKKEKATMWQRDQALVAKEAESRAEAGTLGIERIPR